MIHNRQPEWCVADAAVLLELNQTATLPALLYSGIQLLTSANSLADLDDECRVRIKEQTVTGLITIESAPETDLIGHMSQQGAMNRLTDTERSLCRMAGIKKLPLLSGCGCLSRFAEQHHITVRSIVWVLDFLISRGVILPVTAITKLSQLQSGSPWMNHALCQAKIKAWQNLKKPIKILGNCTNPKLHSA
jgi:hypothetical protein